MTWLRTKCATNLQDSDPDLLVRGTDPQIRIRTKKSQIHNTAYNYFYTCKCEIEICILVWTMKSPYFSLKIRLLITDFLSDPVLDLDFFQIGIRIRNVYFGSGSDPDPSKSFGATLQIFSLSWLVWTREKVKGITVHKAGSKYQHDRLYLQPINSDKHLPQSPFTGKFFRWRHLLRYRIVSI
jgi:hypothetical protein